jgi:hypothetical protein
MTETTETITTPKLDDHTLAIISETAKAATAAAIAGTVQALAPMLRGSTVFPKNEELWNAQQCADYFGISKDSFMRKYAPDTNFPLPVNPRCGSKRWKAQAVMKYHG